jgi:hypothetical protein
MSAPAQQSKPAAPAAPADNRTKFQKVRDEVVNALGGRQAVAMVEGMCKLIIAAGESIAEGVTADGLAQVPVLGGIAVPVADRIEEYLFTKLEAEAEKGIGEALTPTGQAAPDAPADVAQPVQGEVKSLLAQLVAKLGIK